MLQENIQKNIYRSTSNKFAGIIGFTVILGFMIGELLISLLLLVKPSVCATSASPTVFSFILPLIVITMSVFMLYILITWLKKTFVLALRQKDEELKKHAYEPSGDELWDSEEVKDNDKD